MGNEYETVFTVTDYYDGPREGVADFHGRPHAYQSVFDDDASDWSPVFLLRPVDLQTFALVMEDWQIWCRWEEAFHEGGTPHAMHPALPEDRERDRELDALLAERLAIDPVTALRAQADFRAVAGQELPPGVMRRLQLRWKLSDG